ncbi:MAG: 16S rRNA (cytosine(1402)-N(4))-methyltransferase RsmH [Anaerolineae bacterium]|jgi:16S rRNA (cytosine1402-N4)-methyltransferase|nr:16S rRNA (cytosine(1402)-N(4))-methyltransferase RsmH [Anaerolineae bacterium]
MAHIPVLLEEVLTTLIPNPAHPPQRVIDGTLGAGGHTAALLERGVGAILAFDLDPHAIAIAREKLAIYGEKAHLIHASYTEMRDYADQHGWNDGVDAILLDLGVSSMQLDTPERGFSFMRDGDLDMRFDPQGDRLTAAQVVNTWDESELVEIFFRYGEENDSRRLARAIVAGRPYQTTRQLADLIERAAKKHYGKGKPIHPATRIFQALRIAVNEELTVIESTLPIAIDLLRPGGRLAVISFHSLEDRIVKQTFREASTEIRSPPGMVLREKPAVVQWVNKKPMIASESEIAHNARSRSAKLRVVEKLAPKPPTLNKVKPTR